MTSVGIHNFPVATFRYDFDEHGGAVGAITLDGDQIPDNALVLRCWTEAVDAVTSGGAATIALGLTGNADAFEGATAYTDNSYDTPGTVDVKASELPLKVDNADGVDVIATVAGAALTGGSFDVHVEFLPGR